jgi:tRNA-uridine 2-sulfurtransferase
MHWISPGDVTELPLECAVKTRYRQNDLACVVRASGDEWRVKLDRPARSVTPGQYAVFYQGDRCLGGGIIASRFNSELAPAAGRITYNSLFSVEGS